MQREQLSELVLNSLDAETAPGDLARQSFHSRSKFFRLFQALIAESPGAMRRRLLLERAAFHLSRTTQSVTQIALDAEYGSLEAFTRLGLQMSVFGWQAPDRNLREILDRMILTKEVWVAALTKGPMQEMEPSPEQRTPQAMRQRSERAEAAFARVMSEVRDRGAWDETFVDALCEPPNPSPSAEPLPTSSPSTPTAACWPSRPSRGSA